MAQNGQSDTTVLVTYLWPNLTCLLALSQRQDHRRGIQEVPGPLKNPSRQSTRSSSLRWGTPRVCTLLRAWQWLDMPGRMIDHSIQRSSTFHAFLPSVKLGACWVAASCRSMPGLRNSCIALFAKVYIIQRYGCRSVHVSSVEIMAAICHF
jgi:hypothetical protein